MVGRFDSPAIAWVVTNESRSLIDSMERPVRAFVVRFAGGNWLQVESIQHGSID
jgi:hypothetical protein